MKTIYKLLFIAMAMTLFTGCYGAQVSVGAGEVGKIITEDGMQSGVVKTSTFRLPWCGGPGMVCHKLVRLQVAKSTRTFKVDQIFLTASEVDLADVEVGVQFQVKKDQNHLDDVFDNVLPKEGVITREEVWATYLERTAPAVAIAVIRENGVEQVLSEIPEIRAEVLRRLNLETENLPVEVTDVGFPNGIGDIPENVMNSYRNLYAVEADKARLIKQLKADLEVERQRIIVQEVRAKNDKKLASLLGMPNATFMALKIDERFADAVSEAATHDQPFALGAFPLK